MRQAVSNCTTQYYINSTVNHSLNDSNLDFNVTLTDETYKETYLTLDTYLIDTGKDPSPNEFQDKRNEVKF